MPNETSGIVRKHMSYSSTVPAPLDVASVSSMNDEPQQEKTTAIQSLIHLIKGYIGPGCLSLPWAFSQLGIVGGILASVLLSLWSSYNCWRVLRLKRYILRRQQHEQEDSESSTTQHLYSSSMTYPDVGEWAYGRRFRAFVLSCICVQQLAICTVFLSFVGENTVAVLQRIMDGHVSHFAVITLCMPAVLGLSCIPNLKRLSPITAAGTILLLLAFVMLGIVIAQNWSHDEPSDKVEMNLSRVPLAMCAILYSYEGINLILPIENAMKDKSQFKSVFVSAMVICCIIFATVASISVLAFGKVDNGSITAFLMTHEDEYAGSSWVLMANTAVTFSVLLTYPLQLFPCLELVGPWFYNVTSSKRGHHEPLENRFEQLADGETGGDLNNNNTPLEQDGIMRTDSMDNTENVQDTTFSPMLRLVLVMLTYVVAVVIPNVQVLISLAGALAGSSTALLIPPLLELKKIQHTSNDSWSKMQCYLLFGLGVVFCLIGTSASLIDIIRLYL